MTVWKVESFLEDGSGSISVPVTAENTGSAYNVLAGQITEIVTPIPGMDSVTNASDWLTVIGLDTESDESLRARCLVVKAVINDFANLSSSL